MKPIVNYFRCRKIPVKPSRTVRRGGWEPARGGTVAWTHSPPFVANPRGVLIHRVRHVTTILWDGKVSHYHADFLCSNGCNIETGDVAEILVADPPKDRLLCVNCEKMAAKWKLPDADRLAGRHVHRGVLVARQTCCGGGTA